jgi:hypothetical protein
MRITESRLRRIIRSVIVESVNMESVYPFKISHDGDENIINTFNELCVGLASIASYIVYDEPYENYGGYSSSHEIEIHGLRKDREKAVKDAFNALIAKCKNKEIFIGRIGELSKGYEDHIVEEEGGKKIMALIGKFCSKDLGFQEDSKVQDKPEQSSSYIGELFNKRCQDYYKNPYDDPEDPEPNTYVNKYDYYDKIKDIFTIGGNVEASLADSVDKLGLTKKLGGAGSKNLLFINKLYQSLDPKLPRDENLNTLLGFIIDLEV